MELEALMMAIGGEPDDPVSIVVVRGPEPDQADVRLIERRETLGIGAPQRDVHESQQAEVGRVRHVCLHCGRATR
jgi:hypothetical protein